MNVGALHNYRFGYLTSESWKTVRAAVLSREGGHCQLCGIMSASNDSHHIWYPENIWHTRPEQVVLLCRACHTLFHALYPDSNTKVREIGETRWIRFRTAIELWRTQKREICNGEISRPGKVKDLRKAYDHLKQQIAEFGFAAVPERSEAQKLEAVIRQIREWFLASESASCVQNPIADKDYEI